jgi:ribonuclease D
MHLIRCEQVAAKGEVYVFDVMELTKVNQIQPFSQLLHQVLADKEIIKIFHDMSLDVYMLRKVCERE